MPWKTLENLAAIALENPGKIYIFICMNHVLLKQRYLISLAKYAFDRHLDLSNLSIASRNTRLQTGPLLMVPHYKLETTRRALDYRAAIFWNSLSPYLRNINDINVFISEITDIQIAELHNYT